MQIVTLTCCAAAVAQLWFTFLVPWRQGSDPWDAWGSGGGTVQQLHALMSLWCFLAAALHVAEHLRAPMSFRKLPLEIYAHGPLNSLKQS